MTKVSRSPIHPNSQLEVLETRITPAVLYAVTSAGQFVAFDSSDPSTFLVNETVTGLLAGETIEGLDFRPATGELYALGIVNGPNANDSEGRIYTINPATGAATLVGTEPFSTTLTDGARYGFDFNPTSDRIRVVNGSDQNLRVNPATGGLVQFDTPLSAGVISGTAYDRNFAATIVTTLYGIDFTGNQLVRIGGVDGSPSPNGGEVTPVGPLGVALQTATGFDIAPDGTAFLAATLFNSDQSRLYSVDLTTGAATDLGLIMETLANIRGVAVELPRVTISANGKSATYTDVDGDLVTVKASQGTLDASDFVLFSAGGPGRAQLGRMILSDDGGEFQKTKLTFTAKKSPTGDGRVNVGWIDSTDWDLGGVTVNGDLGKVTAGDADLTQRGLGFLKARSLGLLDISTQGPLGDLVSEIKSGAGPIKIAGDVRGATLKVNNADLASIFIGGSFIGDGLNEGGSISTGVITGNFTIRGNIVGGDFTSSGLLSVGGAKSFIVGGSISSGTAIGSAQIFMGSVPTVKIGGDIRGGASGGSIQFSFTKTVALGGSIIGANNSNTGVLTVSNAKTVTIGRDIVGGSVTGNVGSDRGGSLSVGKVKTVIVRGSIIGGVDNSTGDLDESGAIIINQAVDHLIIKGSLIGNATHPVTIAARGALETDPVFIDKFTIGGSVVWANILSGYSKGFDYFPSDGDGSIGAVSVKGDWIASSIAAGIVDVDGDGFGDFDDIVIPDDNSGSILSRIASITIKGNIYGSGIGGDRFAFTAEEIGKLTVGGRKLTLTSAPEELISLAPLTMDVFVREV